VDAGNGQVILRSLGALAIRTVDSLTAAAGAPMTTLAGMEISIINIGVAGPCFIVRESRRRGPKRNSCELRKMMHHCFSMNIQVAVLCDAATDDNGKLNLLGAFDTIYTQQLPAVHPQCSVALRVTFGHEDEGAHKLRLNFVDADGHSIMPGVEVIDIPVEVTLPGESHFGTRNFIVNIQQLKFGNPGLYSMDVSLDNQPQASIPLLVKYNPPSGVA
jgi:Family of unknown function (DUF6941)